MRKHPLVLFSISVFLLLGIYDDHAVAQTIARPTVSIVTSPGIMYGGVVADVDRDGRPDLIGATASMTLAIARGNGDGSFAEPRLLGRNTVPIAVADFNGDTFADIVTAEMAVLPGRGDGTFGTARPIDTTVHIERDIIALRAIARDFNGDGRRDLAIVDGLTVVIYPGNGDLTFGSRFTLPPAGDGAVAITSADFNGDGRPDIAATTIGQSVELFRNDGAFLFSVSSIGQPSGSFGDQWGIASADLNGDGAVDLVVATSYYNGYEFTFGAFHVFTGHGDGTFQGPANYETGVRGTLTVAIGDFNADGHPDIATGNRSWRYQDTPCTGRVYWDSVTIAAGTGTLAFISPANFRLDTKDFGSLYQNTHNALIAVDVNGDGRTDLVTAPGASLLNRPAVANRAPQVSAGPDQTQEPGSEIRFEALATDADFDWLDFLWRDASGAVVGAAPNFCQQEDPGDYTVTVSDGRGGTASDTFTVFPPNPDSAYLQIEDVTNTVGTKSPYAVRWSAANLTGAATFRLLSSADDGKTFTAISGCSDLPITATECTWAAPGPVTDTARLQIEALDASTHRLYFDASARFSIVAGYSISLPAGWFGRDIGAVAATGNSSFDGTVFTVRGSGADVWGTADELHFAYTIVDGDFVITARVASVQNINQWTKAGVMIREQTVAGARQAYMLVTPTVVKGTAFQRRVATGGTSVSTAGPATTPPYWVRLSRVGNTISAYTRPTPTSAWTLVASQTYSALAATLYTGLAVSSHVDGTLATATFDNVLVRPDQIVSSAWSEEDVGVVAAEGTASVSGTAGAGAASVTGSGADIWGTADEFHWAFRHASGDFSFQTLVDSVQNVNAWTKAGLMIRASGAPGAQHASLFATPGATKGVAFQARRVTNGTSAQISAVAVAPSVWLRVTRRGSTINAYYRPTLAQPWRHMGSVVLDGLPTTVEIGFAVSSHVDGTLATATFQQFTIDPLRPWSTARVGPGLSDSFVDGTFFSVENQGADVWGTSDAFTYVYTKWSGDGALTARLNHLDDVNAWTKGGLMFRQSLDPSSAYVFALISAQRGLALQYRSLTGASSASAATRAGAAPAWLQIIREGNAFTMYVSTDTSLWFRVGQVVATMPTELYVGLAVTSHNTSAGAWGFFDDVTLRLGAFNPEPVPTGDTSP